MAEPTTATTGHRVERLAAYQEYTVLTPPVAVVHDAMIRGDLHLEPMESVNGDDKLPRRSRYPAGEGDLIHDDTVHHQLQERMDFIENRIQEQIGEIGDKLQRQLSNINNLDHNEMSIQETNERSGRWEEQKVKNEPENPDITNVNKEHNRETYADTLRALDETGVNEEGHFKHIFGGEQDEGVHNLGVIAPSSITNTELSDHPSKFEVMAHDQQLLHKVEAAHASLLTDGDEFEMHGDIGDDDPTLEDNVHAGYIKAGADYRFAEELRANDNNRINPQRVPEWPDFEEANNTGWGENKEDDIQDRHIEENVNQNHNENNGDENDYDDYDEDDLDDGGFPLNRMSFDDLPKNETQKKRSLTHLEFALLVRTIPPDQRRESLRTYNCSKGGNPYCLTSPIKIIMRPSTSVASCSQGLPVDLVILITSSPGHLQERTKIRQTWAMAHRRSKIGVIQYAFLLGRSDSDTEEMMRIESTVHGDILMGDFNDAYRNLTLKTILGYEWFRRECPSSKFLMKTDDDAYINTEALVRYANAVMDTGHVMVGYCDGPRPKKHRGSRSRWYMSDDQYPDSEYPRYCCGCGYIITGHTARDIAEVMHWLPVIPLEDLFTGVAMTRLPYTVHIMSRPRMFAVDYAVIKNKGYNWEFVCRLNREGIVLTQHHFPTDLLLKFYFECGWDYENDYHRHDSW